MELVYRQIFTPNVENINISIPHEWRGMNIEVIAFPVKNTEKQMSVEEKRKKRKELLDKYSIDLSDFKFNRDEANDYD